MSDGPDDCSADVTCSLSDNNTQIVISLPNGAAGNCTDGYLIQLGGLNKTVSVNQSYAAFPIQAVFGSELLNQSVHPVDSAGHRGEPCLFNITGKLPYFLEKRSA